MDERERTSNNEIKTTFPDGQENLGSQGIQEGKEIPKRRSKEIWFLTTIFVLLFCVGIFSTVFYLSFIKGYDNYSVQMEQYFVEYSEQYDYWDVITVEYPRLEGVKDTVQEVLNNLMYDTAMDRVNYWHLEPSDEVKDFQKEYFSVFCSDVNCDVTYHSQYLLSMDYQEYYSAGHPLWMTNGTERALTVDLLTGESYELRDILNINKEFITLWDQAYSDEIGEDYGDNDEIELILSWFLQEDEDINENYVCHPFFYVTDERNFVAGVSLDPILECAYTYKPVNRSFCAELTAEEIEPFRKESNFWKRYDKSEAAGEVLPCEDKKENLWLGENASVWEHEY